MPFFFFLSRKSGYSQTQRMHGNSLKPSGLRHSDFQDHIVMVLSITWYHGWKEKFGYPLVKVKRNYAAVHSATKSNISMIIIISEHLVYNFQKYKKKINPKVGNDHETGKL